MVSKDTVRLILGIIQRNYNKHPLWVDDCVDDWFQALIQYDDLEAEQAAVSYTHLTLPTKA